MTAKANPATAPVEITLSDSTVHNPAFRAIYVGVSGDVKLTAPNGTTVTFKNVPVGVLPQEATVLFSTGTTASEIIGMR